MHSQATSQECKWRCEVTAVVKVDTHAASASYLLGQQRMRQQQQHSLLTVTQCRSGQRPQQQYCHLLQCRPGSAQLEETVRKDLYLFFLQPC
jgi:hypothetical protein